MFRRRISVISYSIWSLLIDNISLSLGWYTRPLCYKETLIAFLRWSGEYLWRYLLLKRGSIMKIWIVWDQSGLASAWEMRKGSVPKRTHTRRCVEEEKTPHKFNNVPVWRKDLRLLRIKPRTWDISNLVRELWVFVETSRLEYPKVKLSSFSLSLPLPFPSSSWFSSIQKTG